MCGSGARLWWKGAREDHDIRGLGLGLMYCKVWGAGLGGVWTRDGGNLGACCGVASSECWVACGWWALVALVIAAADRLASKWFSVSSARGTQVCLLMLWNAVLVCLL